MWVVAGIFYKELSPQFIYNVQILLNINIYSTRYVINYV